jgi:hypothetical protein
VGGEQDGDDKPRYTKAVAGAPCTQFTERIGSEEELTSVYLSMNGEGKEK